MNLCQDLAPPKSLGAARLYASRTPCSPGPIDHFLAVSVLDDPVGIPLLWFWLDPRVHENYANDLVPRAVGYSASLIDYFFRPQRAPKDHAVAPGALVIRRGD